MVNSRYAGALIRDCDPVLSVWLACLNRAKSDAQRGDLSAVAWLVTTGIELAEAIAPESGADVAITQLCQEVLADVDKGALAARWSIVEY